MRLLACLIVAPQRGYDEPAILSYAISSFCPTSADGLHDQAVTYLGSDHRRSATFLRGEFLAVREPYTRMKGATRESNGSSSILVAVISSRIGNGFQQKKFSYRSMVGEPWRLVDATGLNTEPFHLASAQPPESARGNLRSGVNKGRVDTHAQDEAPQKVLAL